MNWTKEQPTQTKPYWWRREPNEAWVVSVVEMRGSLWVEFFGTADKHPLGQMSGEWSGPIPEPGEAVVKESLTADKAPTCGECAKIFYERCPDFVHSADELVDGCPQFEPKPKTCGECENWRGQWCCEKEAHMLASFEACAEFNGRTGHA